VTVVDWGAALWERRVRTLEFSEWGYVGRLKAAVRLLHRLHVIDPMIRLGRALQLETPIVLVGTKLALAANQSLPTARASSEQPIRPSLSYLASGETTPQSVQRRPEPATGRQDATARPNVASRPILRVSTDWCQGWH
jgi:hypothetical protein